MSIVFELTPSRLSFTFLLLFKVQDFPKPVLVVLELLTSFLLSFGLFDSD